MPRHAVFDAQARAMPPEAGTTEDAAERTEDSSIDAAAERLGRWWAAEVRQELAVLHRCVEGGWPGTVSQARALALAHLHGPLSRRMAASKRVLRQERSVVVLYAAARDTWLKYQRVRARRVAASLDDQVSDLEPRAL